MAQNDFLEGIRKGVQSFLQTRQMMQQYQGNQLQQETMKMQQEALKRAEKERETPEQVRGKRKEWYASHPPATNEGETVWYDYDGNPHITKKEMSLEEKNKAELDMLREKLKLQQEFGKPKESGGMNFKDLKSAQEVVNDIMIRGGVDTDKPDAQGLYNKLLTLTMSGPDGYQRAFGYMKLHSAASSGKYPELEDPGLDTPMQITGENGQAIQVDPQQYLESVATFPNSTEKDLEQAIGAVIYYYGSRGMLQNPSKQFIHGQGPEPPIDIGVEMSKGIKAAAKRMYEGYTRQPMPRTR